MTMFFRLLIITTLVAVGECRRRGLEPNCSQLRPCVAKVKDFNTYKELMPVKSELVDICKESENVYACVFSYRPCRYTAADMDTNLAMKIVWTLCPEFYSGYLVEDMGDDQCSNSDADARKTLKESFKECTTSIKALEDSGVTDECELLDAGSLCFQNKAEASCSDKFKRFYANLFDGQYCSVQLEAIKTMMEIYK